MIDRNVAGKASQSSRERTFRYLREMYLLDASDPTFRALRRLWSRDLAGRPIIALLMACAHDRALSATASSVLSLATGEAATSQSLADAVEREYPGNYSETIRAKIGRNALSSWAQAGYLHRSGQGAVLRQPTDVTPGVVAMALVLGQAKGLSGELLFSTPHAALLGTSSATLHDRTHDAARKGWLEYRSRGQITEVDLTALTSDVDDPRLPLDEGGVR